MSRLRLAVLGAAAVGSAAATAQNLPDMPQISTPAESYVETLPRGDARPGEAPDQLSRPAATAASQEMLGQVNKAKRNAEPPPALSKRSEGRTSSVERVSGNDRCDPANAKKDVPACERVIEARADEYTRLPPPELTPEQHLLLDQQSRDDQENVDDAAHRLATTGDADDSNEAFAIAAIVLRRPEPQPEPDKQEDPTAKAAVEAAIQLATQTPDH